MAAEWPDAVEHMTALRALASRFLSVLERDPEDLPQLVRLLDDLQSGKANAGTGWTMLTDWVDTYLTRVQEKRAALEPPSNQALQTDGRVGRCAPSRARR
jgi:hypothetical protein